MHIGKVSNILDPRGAIGCMRSPPGAAKYPVCLGAVHQEVPQSSEEHEGEELNSARNRPGKGGDHDLCTPERNDNGSRNAKHLPRDDGIRYNCKHEFVAASKVVSNKSALDLLGTCKPMSSSLRFKRVDRDGR